MPHHLSPSSYTFPPPPAARHYHPDLSIWLSVDPMSDKYPGVSPYTYCGNNPVRLKDEDGRTFEVADNDESHKDILSIVSEHHRHRVSFGENGLVSVNTEGLSEEALKKDIGLSLINDMAKSGKVYYYATADYAFCRNENGDRQIQYTFDAWTTKSGQTIGGFFNASVNGLDSQNAHTFLPAAGYDGQVVITETGTFTLYGKNCRSDVVLHELLENYYRTDFGMNYHAVNGTSSAHHTAADRAFQALGRTQGVIDPYIQPQTPKLFSAEQYINYMNHGIWK